MYIIAHLAVFSQECFDVVAEVFVLLHLIKEAQIEAVNLDGVHLVSSKPALHHTVVGAGEGTAYACSW